MIAVDSITTSRYTETEYDDTNEWWQVDLTEDSVRIQSYNVLDNAHLTLYYDDQGMDV